MRLGLCGVALVLACGGDALECDGLVHGGADGTSHAQRFFMPLSTQFRLVSRDSESTPVVECFSLAAGILEGLEEADCGLEVLVSFTVFCGSRLQCCQVCLHSRLTALFAEFAVYARGFVEQPFGLGEVLGVPVHAAEHEEVVGLVVRITQLDMEVQGGFERSLGQAEFPGGQKGAAQVAEGCRLTAPVINLTVEVQGAGERSFRLLEVSRLPV